RFKLRDVPLENLQLRRATTENSLNDMLDERLTKLHIVFKIGERDFGLDHPELSQVFASLGFFSAESRPKNINLSKRQRADFAVKLAGLREIRFLVKVLSSEKSRCPFASTRS